MMNTWNNGERGKVVRDIISKNFENLDARVNNLANGYVLYFSESDWLNGTIFIEHLRYNKRQNPIVDLYIKNGNSYSSVYDGYEVKEDGIELQSDMKYAGKVVIR